MAIKSTQSIAKAKLAFLDKLCEQISIATWEYKGKVPFGLTAKLVMETNVICP